MRVFLFIILSYVAVNANVKNIDKTIIEYFNSPIYNSFLFEKWVKFRTQIDNSIESILKETYGQDSMNVYVRKWSNPFKLSDGFLVSDNIVKVLFKDLYLTQMPRLDNPDVMLDLPSNTLEVEAKVFRMFIQADYQLFRNLSDVTYSSANLNPYKTSPFSLQQVKSNGEVTIVAEDCTLSGLVMTTLQDHTVNLGYDSIKLRGCEFSVEISTPGLGSPPVIAPYFSKEQGMQLQLLLAKPISSELLPKLQAAVFTYVNTSAILGDLLPKIREHQQNLFLATSFYQDEIIRKANEITMDENSGIEKLKDISIKWTNKDNRQIQDYQVVLKDMTITGLDSAYSAHNGGAYKILGLTLCDTVRFSSLQIRGSLRFSVGEAESQYIFYGEIHDITAHVLLSVDSNRQLQSENKTDGKTLIGSRKVFNRFEVSGWRKLDLHAPNLPKISSHSLITGIILNEVPNFVSQRLSRSFTNAVGGDKSVDVSKSDENQITDVGESQNNDAKSEIENEIIVNIEHQSDNENNANSEIENEMTVKMEHQDGYENNANSEIENEMIVKMEHQDDYENNYNDGGVHKKKNLLAENKNMFNQHMFDENMFKENMFGGGLNSRSSTDDDEHRKLSLRASDYIKEFMVCPIKLKPSTDVLNNVTFRLFTRDNKKQYILLNEKAEPVDPKKKVNLANAPLKVVTHGWTSSADSQSVASIKNAYLESRNLNIIALDWSTMAAGFYCKAVRNVETVGRGLSRFLEAVKKRYGVKGDNMHLIGHSLGAHVVGIAAGHATFKIGRVTGLDPAAPFFEYPVEVDPSKRIDSSDANFVDIIHTDGGILGMVKAIGHADFYPNSGVFFQPDCLKALNPASCSHARAHEFFAKSITNNKLYPSWKCGSWSNFQNKKCDFEKTDFMGDGTITQFKGTYFLSTIKKKV